MYSCRSRYPERLEVQSLQILCYCSGYLQLTQLQGKNSSLPSWRCPRARISEGHVITLGMGQSCANDNLGDKFSMEMWQIQVKAGNLCSSTLPPLGSMEYFCRGQHEVQFFSVADYEAWKAGGLYPLQRLIPEVHRHGKRINGHFRNLNWRYLPYIRHYKAYIGPM
jgi:hypothetical protein